MPANTPTPIERAGLTEVPVALIEAKWIIASARPMASGPIATLTSLRSSVTARITQRKTAVITISSSRAAHQAKPVPWSPKKFCAMLPSALKPSKPWLRPKSIAPARSPPRSWAAK